MLTFIKNLFKSETVNLAAHIKEGALVVDVRSKSEFSSGHAKGSINIPLEQITLYLDKFKAQKHVIICCRSGNRSAHAMRLLNQKGLKNITNGGSWQNVNQFIN